METLERAGVITDEVTIRDGSGLSRLSLVTPVQIVNLLEFMYHHPAFSSFFNSLPVAGADGTLSARMAGTCAEGNVRAKTGFSTHNGSLSGYVRKKDGEMVAFSMLTNNNPRDPSEIRRLQDSFCAWLCGQE
jgi:D-alanyl-D-alanine carboxypeptidase/D-alanyl-D-alanine-endopeptidase (penicillin-binding protein 4)